MHLRQRWKPRELWVDAICINQDDDANKAAQIPLMGKVYFLASRVIIWQGLPDEQTTQTLALVRKLAINAQLEAGLVRPKIYEIGQEEYDAAKIHRGDSYHGYLERKSGKHSAIFSLDHGSPMWLI